MTIGQLCEILGRLVEDGHGGDSVLFDTEARMFRYHMASIGSADHEMEPKSHLALREDGRHDAKGTPSRRRCWLRDGSGWDPHCALNPCPECRGLGNT
jgi:hypothetical protein